MSHSNYLLLFGGIPEFTVSFFQTLAPFFLHEKKKVNKITYFDEVVNALWQLLNLINWLLVNDIPNVILLKISIYVVGSTWRGTSIYWTVE